MGAGGMGGAGLATDGAMWPTYLLTENIDNLPRNTQSWHTLALDVVNGCNDEWQLATFHKHQRVTPNRKSPLNPRESSAAHFHKPTVRVKLHLQLLVADHNRISATATKKKNLSQNK